MGNSKSKAVYEPHRAQGKEAVSRRRKKSNVKKDTKIKSIVPTSNTTQKRLQTPPRVRNISDKRPLLTQNHSYAWTLSSDEEGTAKTRTVDESFGSSSSFDSPLRIGSGTSRKEGFNTPSTFADPMGFVDLSPLETHRDDNAIAVTLCNARGNEDNFLDEDDPENVEIFQSVSEFCQQLSSHTDIERILSDEYEEEGKVETRNSRKPLVSQRSSLILSPEHESIDTDITMTTATTSTKIPSRTNVRKPNPLNDSDRYASDASSLPGFYHCEVGKRREDDSLASKSLFSRHDYESTDMESIGNLSTDPSLSDLSIASSIVSLQLKRKKRRLPSTPGSQFSSNRSGSVRPSLLHQTSSRRRIRHSSRPTAENAFETLPRHLIKTALVRQAASTLRDDRFVTRRIVKLGAVQAAKIHVSDFECFDKRDKKDTAARELARKGELMMPFPTSSSFADGEDLVTVTLDSFDVFERCLLELCGIETNIVDLGDRDGELTSDIDDEEDMEGVESGEEEQSTEGKDDDGKYDMAPPPKRPAIDSYDGGSALFHLGKYLHRHECNDDAMSLYRHALYLLLFELDIEETFRDRLLDNLDDCGGFFYVQVARMGAKQSSRVHQVLGALFTKMGDIHGKIEEEVNDALHAYRAAQVFWTRFITDHPVKSIEDCENVSDLDKLKEYAVAVEGMALTHNRIGGVYCAKGDLSDALTSFHEGLDLQIDALGEDHLEVAKTLHNIGVCHRHNDDLEKALEYYCRAYKIFEVNLGKDHLDTVRTLHNIGGVHRRRKQFGKAMECFRDVLKARRAALGDNHPSVSITLVSMAAVLRRSGNEAEANKFYSAALK